MKRFALTHINKDGMRQLTRANQGRNHFPTKEIAEDYLFEFYKSNSTDQLNQIFGKQSEGTFEIREVDCYDHGDAKGIYFDDIKFDVDKCFEGC